MRQAVPNKRPLPSLAAGVLATVALSAVFLSAVLLSAVGCDAGPERPAATKPPIETRKTIGKTTQNVPPPLHRIQPF